jgi:DNA polymerase III delta subunit
VSDDRARAATPDPPSPATPSPPLAYLWGEDAFSLEQAANRWAQGLLSMLGEPAQIWRAGADDDSDGASDGLARRRTRVLDDVEQRLATAPLFGGGTAVIVRQPAALLRETAARTRTLALIGLVAPGNGLCFIDLVAAGAKTPAANGALRDAIEVGGGTVEHFPALARERMEAWLDRRARELGVRFGPGAARLLAERVGAYVREGDVDRRRQSELANAELEKLALYRPAGTISRDDIAEMVADALPGSTWAFLDAIGYRRTVEAAPLAERLLNEGAPLPLLIAQLHRRLRELIVVRDHLASGTKPAELVRLLKLQPFRAQKLTEQARTWPPEQLDDALRGLLALDLLSKGIGDDGNPRAVSEDRSQLALLAWIGERVSRAGRLPTAVGPGRPTGV